MQLFRYSFYHLTSFVVTTSLHVMLKRTRQPRRLQAEIGKLEEDVLSLKMMELRQPPPP